MKTKFVSFHQVPNTIQKAIWLGKLSAIIQMMLTVGLQLMALQQGG